MEEFLNKLYNYEYFGTYLMISIAVLVLLFIIVLVFGKKDQKEREIEETKKLQQVKDDAFKEESAPQNVEVAPETLEVQQPAVSSEAENPVKEEEIVPSINPIEKEEVVNEIPEPVIPNENIKEIPNINANVEEAKVEDKVNVAPVVEPPVVSIPEVKMPEVVAPLEVDHISVTKEEIKPVEPIFQKEEEKPFSFEDTTPVSETPVVEVPTFNYDEIVNNIDSNKKNDAPKEVFSSVYVKEEKKEEEEVKEETEEIELPTLKKDEEEKPVLNDLNLNDLSGETYDINK